MKREREKEANDGLLKHNQMKTKSKRVLAPLKRVGLVTHKALSLVCEWAHSLFKEPKEKKRKSGMFKWVYD